MIDVLAAVGGVDDRRFFLGVNGFNQRRTEDRIGLKDLVCPFVQRGSKKSRSNIIDRLLFFKTTSPQKFFGQTGVADNFLRKIPAFF